MRCWIETTFRKMMSEEIVATAMFLNAKQGSRRSRFHKAGTAHVKSTACGLYHERVDSRGRISLLWIPRRAAEKAGLTPCRICYT